MSTFSERRPDVSSPSAGPTRTYTHLRPMGFVRETRYADGTSALTVVTVEETAAGFSLVVEAEAEGAAPAQYIRIPLTDRAAEHLGALLSATGAALRRLDGWDLGWLRSMQPAGPTIRPASEGAANP